MADTGCFQLGAGDDVDHAGYGAGGGCVDALDPGVSMRRADEGAPGSAGDIDVVGELAAALDEPDIFFAPHRLPNSKLANSKLANSKLANSKLADSKLPHVVRLSNFALWVSCERPEGLRRAHRS